MKARQYAIYIMSNLSRSVYVGMTNNLTQRGEQHRRGLGGAFTKTYKCSRLVYYELTGDVKAAIAREKQIKGWVRRKKVELIESVNPRWEDLSSDWRFDDGDPCISETAYRGRRAEAVLGAPGR